MYAVLVFTCVCARARVLRVCVCGCDDVRTTAHYPKGVYDRASTSNTGMRFPAYLPSMQDFR